MRRRAKRKGSTHDISHNRPYLNPTIAYLEYPRTTSHILILRSTNNQFATSEKKSGLPIPEQLPEHFKTLVVIVLSISRKGAKKERFYSRYIATDLLVHATIADLEVGYIWAGVRNFVAICKTIQGVFLVP
jgi:hypothetical protein